MRIDELKALAEDAKVGYLAGGNVDELFIRLLTAVENLDAPVVIIVSVPTPTTPTAAAPPLHDFGLHRRLSGAETRAWLHS